METTEKLTFSEKLARGLRKAANEIEEFSVQAKLGRMEARDLFEDLKKSYRIRFNDVAYDIHKAEEISDELGDKLRTAFEELRVQLALGKAESRDLFEEQSKRIKNAAHKLQQLFVSSEIPDKYKRQTDEEVAKLKAKLDIIKLKYAGKKFVSSDFSKQRKTAFVDKLKTVGSKFSTRKKSRWNKAKNELSEAWYHLKKVFR